MSEMFCFQCEQTAGCTGCTGRAGHALNLEFHLLSRHRIAQFLNLFYQGRTSHGSGIVFYRSLFCCQIDLSLINPGDSI